MTDTPQQGCRSVILIGTDNYEPLPIPKPKKGNHCMAYELVSEVEQIAHAEQALVLGGVLGSRPGCKARLSWSSL